ncbi:MAG: M56 family metallopeptidase [Gemmataceae bacterium]
MTGFGPAAEWAARTALAGGTVLLLGLAWAALTRCPARRQRVAAVAIRGAVLAAALCLLPGWLRVPVPSPSHGAPPRGEPSAVAGSLPAGDPDGADDPADEWVSATVGAAAPVPQAEPDEGEEAPLPAATAVAPALLPEVVPVLLGAYFLTAGVMALQLAVGHLALVRLVWSAAPAPPRVRAALDEVADGRRPRVLASDQVGSPVCFGLLRPVIVLPWELARTASAAELRWVLAHELDHLARGDHRTGWWVGLARAVFFPVLWFWPLRRTLHLAQEYLADAAAAAVGGKPTDYAEFLVNLSDRPARVPALASGVRAGRSDLFLRVTMLLNPTAGLSRRPSRGWRYLTAGGVLSAAVLLSGLTPATADDPKPKPNPDAVEVEVVVQPPDAPKPPAKPDAPKVTRVEVRRVVDKAAVADLKAKIKDAIKKGDAEEADRLVERLEKLLSGPTPPVPPPPPPPPGVPGKPRGPQPPVPPKGPDGMRFEFRIPPEGFDPFTGPGGDKMREGMERGMKALREAMEKADSPEAKEGMKKAMEALERAMTQGRKQADDAAREGRRAAEGAMKQAEQERRKALDALREQAEELRRRSEDQKLPEEARRKLEQLQRDRSELQKRLGEDMHRKVEEAQRLTESYRKRAAEDMLRKDATARPQVWLGLQLARIPDELAEQIDLPAGEGLLIAGVLPDSAAAKAGVKKNDILVRFNGKPVTADEKAFAEAVAKTAAPRAELVVLRKGKKQTIGVELGEARKPAETRKPDQPRAESRRLRVEVPDAKDGPRFNRVEARVNDDSFTITATMDETKYEIRGRIEDGKPTAESITIRGGDDKVSAKSLDQVPEKHRAAVKKLLGSVSGR